jgi:hypothetical protein
MTDSEATGSPTDTVTAKPDITGEPDVGVNEPALDRVQRRRSELKAAMSGLDGALRQLDDIDPGRWLGDVRQSFTGLVTAFEQHVRLHEGPESFHAEILKSQPHLASRVTRLQRDHVKLRSTLDGLAAALESAGSDAIDQVTLVAKDLLHQLDVHRRRGAALVWEAFNYDLGGEH